MDFIKKFITNNENENENQGQGEQQERREGESQHSEEKSEGSGGFLGGLGDKLNSAAGGGKESEKNEDMLDKGSCFPAHDLGFLIKIWTDCHIQELISSKRNSSVKESKIMSLQ
jgi:hypothetical protein